MYIDDIILIEHHFNNYSEKRKQIQWLFLSYLRLFGTNLLLNLEYKNISASADNMSKTVL